MPTSGGPNKINLEYKAIIVRNIKYLTNSENYVIISKIHFWPSQIRSLK
jgi:hypothetical protein